LTTKTVKKAVGNEFQILEYVQNEGLFTKNDENLLV